MAPLVLVAGILAMMVPSVGGIRCTFVTIVLSEDFVECTAVLVHSIRATDTVNEVTVLVLPFITAVARNQLKAAGADHVVEVEEVKNPNRNVLYRVFSKNYSILRVWQLGTLLARQYDRAVYMDGDMVMTQNSDELCSMPELSAARDLGAPGARHEHSNDFNAGMMVLAPQEDTFTRLVELAQHIESPSGGVQPLLRAAFPEWTRLDHLRDNVNAHVFDHQRSSWRLAQIRSIHYTGPVKPCFTDAEEFSSKPSDEPFRTWHRLRERRDAPERHSSPEAPPGGDVPRMDNALSAHHLAAQDAWKSWFAVPDESILVKGFGLGESEYHSVPAYHVCKHGSAVLSGLAERIFKAGFSQLRECFQGTCSATEHVTNDILRGMSWMHRMLHLYMQRSSIDAQADVEGLGSVESILALHADATVADVQTAVRSISAKGLEDTQSFVFDMVVSLSRQVRRREQLTRWHLSYALLGLLWWQYRHLRDAGSDLLLPDPFQLEFPLLEFQDVCCRVPDVLGHLLRGTEEDRVLMFADEVPLGMGVEEYIASVIQHAAVFVAAPRDAQDVEPEPNGAATLSANRVVHHDGQLHLAQQVDHVEVARISVIFMTCPSRDAMVASAEDQYRSVLADLEYWSHKMEGGSAVVAGCGFTAQSPGIVEAVSQHALRRATRVKLAADTAWWILTSPSSS